MFEKTDTGTCRSIDAQRNDINNKSIQTNRTITMNKKKEVYYMVARDQHGNKTKRTEHNK